MNDKVTDELTRKAEELLRELDAIGFCDTANAIRARFAAQEDEAQEVREGDTPCGHCGETRDAHHEFEAVKRPASCVCDWREWGDPFAIRDVCEAHVGDRQDCERCEHDKECHDG